MTEYITMLLIEVANKKFLIAIVQSGGSPHCRCCSDPLKPDEDIPHILLHCSAYKEIRERLLNEIRCLSAQTKHKLLFDNLDNTSLSQFILDPSSMNLKHRVSINDAHLSDFIKLSCDLCFSINKKRLEILRTLSGK